MSSQLEKNTIVIKDERILPYIKAHPTRGGVIRVLNKFMG